MAFIPAWRPFDPKQSSHLFAGPGPQGRIMALCASPLLAARGESARLAMSIAGSLAASGEQVVLADGALEHPVLHDSAGLSNGAGLVDLLLTGGVPERLAHLTDTRGLSLIVAGSAVSLPLPPEAREKLSALCSGLRAGRVTLAVYVPLGSKLAEWVIEESTDIVLLALEEERAGALLSADEFRVRALVGPAPTPHGPRGMARDPHPSSAAAKRQSEGFVVRSRPVPSEPLAPSAPPAPRSPPTGDPPFLARSTPESGDALIAPPAAPLVPVVLIRGLDEPYLGGLRRRGRRRWWRVAGAAVVVVGAAGAVWVWLATLERPPVSRPGDPQSAPEAAEPAPRPVGAAEERPQEAAEVSSPTSDLDLSPHQRFSWGVAAFTDAGTARTVADRFRTADPNHAFIIAPVAVGGRLYFRVLGGLAADRERLTSMRDSLARAIGEDASGWVVRDTPLAFGLGEYTEARAAEARVGELEGAEVPAYALVVDLAGGQRYRVYAGAFADGGEASELLRILRAAGVEGMRLTELRGRFGG